ncbi:MAG: hypothetical protein AAF702_03320 [Chloroflexota bacterium]
MQTLYIATDEGLTIGQYQNSQLDVKRQTLTDTLVTSVIVSEETILAGTKRGIYRSFDCGHTWQPANNGLNTPYVRWLATHPDNAQLKFAGTEPAALFASPDDGATWREAREVATLRDEFGWWLPYSPEAGCVRGFAFAGSRAYAAVEVGAALRSDDGGTTWDLAEGSEGHPVFREPESGIVHPDVHSVEVHPSSADLVFAATAGGLYRSEDGGKQWRRLFECYCRALWLDPEDARHIIFGSADGPSGRNGQIWETSNAGRVWHTNADGLETPWSDALVERFVQSGKNLFGVLSNGQLIVTHLYEHKWRTVWTDKPGVNAVAI